ncbi:MAG TPA: efflux RND transporter periplasmic adaptor subunit, partial [Acidobacteriota bacterium]|nr:efflux RND transporter periplasmic adaptor subunit [Acidobacteriota bacterium]
MQFKTLFLIVVFAALLSACGRKPASSSELPVTTVNVPIETVSQAGMVEQYAAVGTVTAQTSTLVASKIMGQVTAVKVKEGDLVKAGQPLVEIDQRDVAAQMRKTDAGISEVNQGLAEVDKNIQAAELGKQAAEANSVAATAMFQRYQTLLERKSVSQQEFDEVNARYKTALAETARAAAMIEAARARRSQLEARLEQVKADQSGVQVMASFATLTAPISGVITMKAVEVGTMAVPGMPLLRVETGDNFRLEATVEESRLAQITVGKEVPVQVDALGKTPMTGKVAEIVP